MRESIKSKDSKRKLYFSLDMKNFITYLLDQNTTCDKIYQDNNSSIESKLSELNNKKAIDLSNFDFFLIDLKEIKKTQGYFLQKIKLNRNILIYNFLQNQKTILCFLPTNPINQETVIKTIEDKTKNSNERLLEMKKKYLKDKIVDNIFNNRTIFLYDYTSKIFNKTKASLNEYKFTIHGKTDIIIYIQDILSVNYCNANHPLIEILAINGGYKPPFYIILKSNENQWILGFKREEKLKLFKSGFDFAFINLNFFMNDINFNIEINDLKSSISQKEEKNINAPINLNNSADNKFKKYILNKNNKDNKLLQLLKGILIYKDLIKGKNYNKAKFKLDEIINICKEENKNEKSNFKKFITDEKISQYLNISNKFNENKIEENKELSKNLLKSELFDDILEEVNKLFINGTISEKFKENVISYNLLLDYNSQSKDTFLEL